MYQPKTLAAQIRAEAELSALQGLCSPGAIRAAIEQANALLAQQDALRIIRETGENIAGFEIIQRIDSSLNVVTRERQFYTNYQHKVYQT